jgi:hypothetical protein
MTPQPKEADEGFTVRKSLVAAAADCFAVASALRASKDGEARR